MNGDWDLNSVSSKITKSVIVVDEEKGGDEWATIFKYDTQLF
jgi:hypothetical protein